MSSEWAAASDNYGQFMFLRLPQNADKCRTGGWHIVESWSREARVHELPLPRHIADYGPSAGVKTFNDTISKRIYSVKDLGRRGILAELKNADVAGDEVLMIFQGPPTCIFHLGSHTASGAPALVWGAADVEKARTRKDVRVRNIEHEPVVYVGRSTSSDSPSNCRFCASSLACPRQSA